MCQGAAPGAGVPGAAKACREALATRPLRVAVTRDAAGLGAAGCSAPQGPGAALLSAGTSGFTSNWSQCPCPGCPPGEGRAPCPCQLCCCLDEGSGEGFGALERTRSDGGWAGR